MKIKFSDSLEYQKEAIDSIVNVFEGQSIAKSNFTFGYSAYYYIVTANTTARRKAQHITQEDAQWKTTQKFRRS